MAEAAKLMPDVEMANSPYAAATGAEAVVIVTEWDIYRALDLGKLRNVMQGSALIDLRNIYHAADVAIAGFSYTGIGR
jgi:UDPglucose 6-dehydrogenase